MLCREKVAVYCENHKEEQKYFLVTILLFVEL